MGKMHYQKIGGSLLTIRISANSSSLPSLQFFVKQHYVKCEICINADLCLQKVRKQVILRQTGLEPGQIFVR